MWLSVGGLAITKRTCSINFKGETMRKLKLAFIAVLVLAFVGCAGVGVQLNDNATTILQNSATSTVGYLIVKNNPQFRDPITQMVYAVQRS